MRVLLIDDDQDLSKSLAETLQDYFAIDTCGRGKEGLILSEINPYDLIILDLGLPDITGQHICVTLREKHIKSRILVLTGTNEIEERIKTLNLGADDYLTKPFSTGELIARIHALLRRGEGVNSVTLHSDKLSLNPVSRQVFYQDQPICLRKKEFDLLEYLLRQSPEIVSREMILDHVWNRDVNIFTNAIDVHISHLRDQIEKPFGIKVIETIHGLGYRINNQSRE